jgi:hypothetical protein
MTRSCDDPLYLNAIALVPETKHRTIERPVCYCDQPQLPFDDVGGTAMKVDLIEVYTADGTLKRTFLEQVNQPAVLERLVAQLGKAPIDEAVKPFLTRELLGVEKWKAHSADGDFQVAAPSGKHPSGKCTIELKHPMNQECYDHEGSDCREVSVIVKGKPVYETRAADEVKLDAWWLPVPKSVLVGVLHYKSENMDAPQRDDVFIAPLPACSK